MADTVPTEQSLEQTKGFRWGEVPSTPEGRLALLGDANARTPNAAAVQMSATFWIETVTEKITVPAYTGEHPVIVQGATNAGNPVVSFSVTSKTPTAAATTIDLSYTQIQYTQTVLLNFNTLTWPHVWVATLVPNEPVPVAL
jgi:hypothetical protein